MGNQGLFVDDQALLFLGWMIYQGREIKFGSMRLHLRGRRRGYRGRFLQPLSKRMDNYTTKFMSEMGRIIIAMKKRILPIRTLEARISGIGISDSWTLRRILRRLGLFIERSVAPFNLFTKFICSIL